MIVGHPEIDTSKVSPLYFPVPLTFQCFLMTSFGAFLRSHDCIYSNKRENIHENLNMKHALSHMLCLCLCPRYQVDSSQRIDEYDDSTQAALRKVMFDQKQKALGLASSDDIAKNDLLNAALNARDSPLSK